MPSLLPSIIGLPGIVGSPSPGSISAASFASSPAPSGYHWEFVTYNGDRVTYGGEPVVALVGD